jgi:hypothetical protein
MGLSEVNGEDEGLNLSSSMRLGIRHGDNSLRPDTIARMNRSPEAVTPNICSLKCGEWTVFYPIRKVGTEWRLSCSSP